MPKEAAKPQRELTLTEIQERPQILQYLKIRALHVHLGKNIRAASMMTGSAQTLLAAEGWEMVLLPNLESVLVRKGQDTILISTNSCTLHFEPAMVDA